MPILFIIFSYLLGSIPTGLLLAKTRNVDIRQTGSGNIGATNVYRTFGWGLAIAVGVADFLKGFLPTLIALFYFHDQIVVALTALAALVGHIFSVYLKFKGGKGAATYAGTLAVILGFKAFICLILLWIILLKLTRIMSLTNLILAGMVLIGIYFLTFSGVYILYSLAAGILIAYAHRSNIIKLRNGTEKRL